jgi:hypothetical protein
MKSFRCAERVFKKAERVEFKTNAGSVIFPARPRVAGL